MEEIGKSVVHLKSLMDRQIKLFESLLFRQIELKKAIEQRQWIETESILDTISTLSNDLQACEIERTRLYYQLKESLNVTDEEPFFQFLRKIPQEQQSEMGKTFSRLKNIVIKVKGKSHGINILTKTKQQLIDECIRESTKEKQGTTYTKEGRLVGADRSQLVVNQQF